MRSIQQRGPRPVPVPVPEPGPPQRQPGVSTQRHRRPLPDPGSTQHFHRAGVSSARAEAAEWLIMAALTGAAPASLLAPTPALNRSTATINRNLDFIRFPPTVTPSGHWGGDAITRTSLMTHRLCG